MTWLALSLLVAVSYAGHGACTKKLLGDYSDAWVRWLLFVVAAPILAVYLATRGVPDVDLAFWPVLAIASFGGALAFWFYTRALRLTDLSIAYPLISLTPLFMVPVEFALLADLPGVLGFVGVVTIVAGVYVLNLRSGPMSAVDPLRAVLRDRGALLALALAAIWAVTGVIDKVAILLSSPAFYAPAVTTAIAILYAPAAWRGRPGLAPARGRSARPEARQLALFGLQGLFFALMYVAQLEAVRLTLVSYVISVKRTGALLSVILGPLLFAEREFGYRLLGTAVILIGILLLALS